MEKLKVVFRKFQDGEVIAMFPTVAFKRTYTILSYMSVGQHADCDPNIIHITKLATKEEYEPLLKELQSLQGYEDYELVVGKKLNIKWQ